MSSSIVNIYFFIKLRTTRTQVVFLFDFEAIMEKKNKSPVNELVFFFLSSEYKYSNLSFTLFVAFSDLLIFEI